MGNAYLEDQLLELQYALEDEYNFLARIAKQADKNLGTLDMMLEPSSVGKGRIRQQCVNVHFLRKRRWFHKGTWKSFGYLVIINGINKDAFIDYGKLHYIYTSNPLTNMECLRLTREWVEKTFAYNADLNLVPGMIVD